MGIQPQPEQQLTQEVCKPLAQLLVHLAPLSPGVGYHFRGAISTTAPSVPLPITSTCASPQQGPRPLPAASVATPAPCAP